MSKYLISTTETYRVDYENEVDALIEEAKQDNKFELTKYNCQHRELKQKGEVVDQWFKVTLNKVMTDEKEPSGRIQVKYGLEDE